MAAGLTQASSGHIFRSNVKALETTARSSVRLAHALDSTISTLVSKLSDPPFKNQQRILTWLATAIQDNAQLAIFLATSLMQRRSDAKASEFSAAEKNELCASMMTNQATLFDQKLALETIDCAKQRNHS